METTCLNIQKLDRFLLGVEKTPTCWLWKKTQTKRGYGLYWFEGKYHLAHRVSYELSIGPVPNGLELDHGCRVHNCVNPKHLEPVTHKINVLRGESISAQRARQTECVNGHPFDDKNTYICKSRGSRECRACNAARKRVRSRA